MANVSGNLHLIIRNERIKQGLSQKKLGELVDLPQQAINRIEQGNRKMDVDLFLKFCEILKIDKIGNFSIKMISSFYQMDANEQNRTMVVDADMDADIDTSHPYEKYRRGEQLTAEEEEQLRLHLEKSLKAIPKIFRDFGEKLKENYQLLNREGQQRAVEQLDRALDQIEMLTKIPEYQKGNEPPED